MRCLRSFASLALLLFLFQATGCSSSTTIQGGAALGKAGSTWATSAASTVTTISTDLDTSVDGQYITQALTGLPAPSTQAAINIKKIEDALRARADLLQALANAYQSLNNLTAYDASKEVESSLTTLDGSINNLASALGATNPPLSNVTGTVTGIVASAIVGDVQAKQVKASSKLIRERLEATQSLLASEKSAIESVEKQTIEDETKAALALFDSGIGVPSAILSEPLANSGLDYNVEQANNAIKAHPKAFQAAVHDVIVRHATARIGLQIKVIDNITTGLATLIAQHKRLEAEQPLDLQAISQVLSQLNTYAQQILSAYQKDHPATGKSSSY